MNNSPPQHLFEILVCPLCKGQMQWLQASSELVCHADRLAFAVRDGVPNLLPDCARPLNEGEDGDLC